MAKKKRKSQQLTSDETIDTSATASVAEPAEKAKVKVVATRLGYYGHQRRKPGVKFVMELPLDDEGDPILPSWVVREKDYVPEPEDGVETDKNDAEDVI